MGGKGEIDRSLSEFLLNIFFLKGIAGLNMVIKITRELKKHFSGTL